MKDRVFPVLPVKEVSHAGWVGLAAALGKREAWPAVIDAFYANDPRGMVTRVRAEDMLVGDIDGTRVLDVYRRQYVLGAADDSGDWRAVLQLAGGEAVRLALTHYGEDSVGAVNIHLRGCTFHDGSHFEALVEDEEKRFAQWAVEQLVHALDDMPPVEIYDTVVAALVDQPKLRTVHEARRLDAALDPLDPSGCVPGFARRAF